MFRVPAMEAARQCHDGGTFPQLITITRLMETERQLMWLLLEVCEVRDIREEEEDAQEDL